MNSVRLNVNVRESLNALLDVLSEQHSAASGSVQQQPSDLLGSVGEAVPAPEPADRYGPAYAADYWWLLDYRSYTEMEVEVNRGSDGWLRAESGALSTGEATVPGCRFW